MKFIFCKRRLNTYVITFYTTVVVILITTALVIWKFRDECYHFPIPPSEEHLRKCGNHKFIRGNHQIQLEFQYTKSDLSSDHLISMRLKSKGIHRDLRTAPENAKGKDHHNPKNRIQIDSDDDPMKHVEEIRKNVTEYFEYRTKSVKEACAKVFYDEDSIHFDTNNEEELLGELKKLEKLERGENRFFQKTNIEKRTRWIFYKQSQETNNVEIQWCPIYKAASTPWMAIFTKLVKALTEITEAKIHSGKITFLTLARDFRLFIHKSDISNIREQAPRYSMVVVRHPFKRLISAYRDKIERVKGREYYYRKYSKKIISHFRVPQIINADSVNSIKSLNHKSVPVWFKMALDIQRRYGKIPPKQTSWVEVTSLPVTSQSQTVSTVENNVPATTTLTKPPITVPPENIKVPTFEEFCRYLLTVDPKNMDEHWRPQYLDCSPCHHNFDLILKVETLEEDKEAVFKLLGYEDPTSDEYIELQYVWERWTNPSKYSNNDSYYFSQLSESLMQDLYQIYELDFELYDYSADQYFEMVNSNK